MALLFSLSAECGHDRHEAEAVARHFDEFAPIIDDGSRYQCSTGVPELGRAWWAICCPEGVSRTGIQSDDDQRVMDAIAIALYERLKTAPPFRYALVGIEIDGFRDYEELNDDVTELDFSGLVLSDAVWRHLGAARMFVPFAPGYRWRPFVRVR